MLVDAAGACDRAAAYLDYVVNVEALAQAATTITFLNPDGDDVRVREMPLRGRATWPGVVVRHDGTVVDWPGWRKERGVWVAGDEFDWALDDIVVEFDAGAVTEVVVGYPDPTEDCVPSPAGAVGGHGASPTPSPSGASAATIAPPETTTLELVPAAPDGRQGLLLLVFAGALAAAGFGVPRLRTLAASEFLVRIETAEEFRSRVARTTRSRPARPSSARARSRVRPA
jgi:hypothetical protein